MNIAGISGIRRGRTPVTTRPAPVPDTRPDLVQRQFKAVGPNRLWVADITYVRTLSGFVYTAFVTDVFSRKIVGWAVRSTLKTEALPLEALEQAIILAKDNLDGLVHHSDHGSQAWQTCTEVEWATLNWVHWWNNTRLHQALGYATPEETIANYNQHRQPS